MTPKFDLLGRSKRFRWVNVTLLALMALAMIGLIVVAFQTIESERAEREQVERTNDILLELRNVSSAAVNAETGQRGYLITLDRRYLESYLIGREQIDPSLRRLRTAMEDEETTRRQNELVDQIEALATSKFAEMDESVRLLEDGRLIDARREMLSDQGQETMERLRRAIGEMERIEFQLLSDATEETARAEGRVLPLLGALMLLLIGSIVAGTRLVARVEAAQAVALGEARDRADLLARELNHRVKNLFAVVLAIIQLSGRDKPESKEVTDGIAERVRALLTAHEVSQGELDRPVASLRALVETTLAPYRSSKLTADIEGDEILLPAKQVTPLGLVLHELTTNAVKYGAWSSGGTIAVDWQRVGDTIKLVWQEQGDAIETEPERRGFGSMLMTSASRQFGGSIEREFLAEGVRVIIELPIEDQQNELPATG